MRWFASLSCNSNGISVNSTMASLKYKNNGLVYRDKLHGKENHEGKWVKTYFKALTQTCRGGTTKHKKVGQGCRPETSMTTWVRAPGVRSLNAASPNYAGQGEDA